MKEQFTVTVLSENHSGLLSRVANIFNRRKLNIESLTVSRSDVEGIHRFNIVLHAEPRQVANVVEQIEKQVEVVKAEAHRDEEIVYQEISLFKVPASDLTGSNEVEKLVRRYNARMLEMNADYVYFEKYGTEQEVNQFLQTLQTICEVQYVRSGRVAISKVQKSVENYNKIPKSEYLEENK